MVEMIDIIKDPRWDPFVMRHPLGWISHLSKWQKALESVFRHINGHCLAIIDQEKIVAAINIYEVRDWLVGHRLVSIPFSTLCDPLVTSADEMEALFPEMISLLNQRGASYLEIRSLNANGLNLNGKWGRSTYYKHHYLLLEKSIDDLKKAFHRSCVKQRINRAEKSGVTVRRGETETDLKQFYGLYLLTRKRLSLPPQPYRFFKVIWEAFIAEKQIEILLAEVNQQAIAGLLLFKFKDRVSAECAGSDEKYIELSPNHLLFWEAIRSARTEGFKIFDFGRTSPQSQSLMDFKSRWGTTVVDMPYYYYPAQNAERSRNKEKSFQYQLVKKVCEKAPLWALEPIGRFCYRHLA